MNTLTWILFGAGWVLQAAVWLRRMEPFWPAAVFAVACTVSAAVSAVQGDAVSTWLSLTMAVINALGAWFWWKRRKRRRAPRTLGAKSRARLAALVNRAREAARPSPVRRPAVDGAR
jgi:hypothetical protein